MTNSPLFVLILVAITIAPLAKGEEPEWRRGFISQADGKQFGSYVSDKALAKAPVWLRGSDQPPVSPRRASLVAHNQLKKTVTHVEQWKLEEVALVDTGDQLHWVYVVRFRPIYPDNKAVFGGDYFNIAVLMDGTPIKPTIVKP